VSECHGQHTHFYQVFDSEPGEPLGPEIVMDSCTYCGAIHPRREKAAGACTLDMWQVGA